MKKILIIEDDTVLLSTLVEGFSETEYEIIKAEDGEKGLSLALEVKPDLILLDLLLPKMDGFTVLKKIRQDKWGANVPVIILTNLGSPESISETMESFSGFQEYLIKTDWKIEDVIAKVRDRLKE